MQKILVVDDEESILKLVTDALEDTYEVFACDTVSKAETIAKENPIDLLVTDLVMPEKNGIDMIMAFKKTHPNMEIMAISGGGGIKGRFDYLPIAKLVGAKVTLEKPFSVSQLRSHVKELLDSRNT